MKIKTQGAMGKIKFSLITSIILLLSSFIPVVQVLLLTANGAFLSVFTSSNNGIILLVNGAASIIMFLVFYFSKSFVAKFFSLIGILFFLLPFLFYATEKIINTENYYFAQFLTIGIITSILLIAVEYFIQKPQ